MAATGQTWLPVAPTISVVPAQMGLSYYTQMLCWEETVMSVWSYISPDVSLMQC